jgi:glycosyltransferase involved in cell wall biosynthesis
MSSHPIEVSVIVPACNGAPYLRGCLDSLLAQRQPGIEIIVVDDGSCDARPLHMFR